MKILYIIPARGGSKGIPHKNIRLLAGKPLICYSIDIARALTTDDNICVSTDDTKIIKVVEDYGLKVPFVRPEQYATDTATTNEVLIHAIEFYEAQGKKYDVIILLQPTSPLRKVDQVNEALSLYNKNLDMVVSVKESHAATVLCNENNEGYLELTINRSGIRRQDVQMYYEYNGAIYIINVDRLKEFSLSGLIRKKKYVMDETSSIDIDNEFDWQLTEFFLSVKNKK